MASAVATRARSRTRSSSERFGSGWVSAALERRKARIELGTEGVELSLSGGGEVLSDRFGQRRQPVERRRDCGSR